MIGKKNVYSADFVHFLPTAYFVCCAFEDCLISNKLWIDPNDYLNLLSIDDDRKFVQINSFFDSVDL